MTGSRKYNFKCQSFPNTIEQERRRRGWTVTKLAELSGVSRYSIAAYETWAAGGIVPKQRNGHNGADDRGRAGGYAGTAFQALCGGGGRA